MIFDLSASFTNETVACDDLLENLLQMVKIKVIGHGIKSSVTVEQIENYVLPSFLLVYYYGGAVSISHAGQTTNIAAGSFYLHEPFEIYSGIRTSRTPLKFSYVNFDILPLAAQRIFKRNAFLQGDSLFKKRWYGRIGANLWEFCQTENNCDAYQKTMLEYMIKCIVAYILHDQLRNSPLASLVHDSRESVLIDQVFAYTEQNLAQPIDIGQMLHILGTSRSTLYRIFRDNMAVSPFKAITRFKIEKSLELMQTGCSVTETARRLGYSSAYHFSNIFKTVMGKRPTEYMKNMTVTVKK